MLSTRTAVVVSLLVFLAIANSIIFLARSQAPPSATQALPTAVGKGELKAVAPELFDRLSRDVARLERESLADSLARLSDVGMFYWPGPMASSGSVVKEYIPLGEEAGHSDLEAIMSNRRFRKIVGELRALDEAAAGGMVNRELSDAIAVYQPLYEAEKRRLAPHYTLDKTAGRTSVAGPTVVIGNVPEGKVVIAGARLKILALVWVSGMLNLSGTRTEVEQVARIALKQRTDLYDDATSNPFFKAEMLTLMSLYNRQIIVSGLLGILKDGALDKAFGAAGLEWHKRELTSHRAALTEFDLPVQSGAMLPDYSRGSLSVRFASPLDDLVFDAVLKRLQLSP